mmetsp:Transcript_40320/g.92564  ORF Transcript_40320/g.92564 Transcript_40320/m.92564 type:complete len:147 (+) Transcript_40320:108-548(+)
MFLFNDGAFAVFVNERTRTMKCFVDPVVPSALQSNEQYHPSTTGDLGTGLFRFLVFSQVLDMDAFWHGSVLHVLPARWISRYSAEEHHSFESFDTDRVLIKPESQQLFWVRERRVSFWMSNHRFDRVQNLEYVIFGCNKVSILQAT